MHTMINVKLTLLGLILLAGGCGRSELFEKPLAGSPELPAPVAETSFITIASRIPFELLRRSVEGSLPATRTFEGDGDEPCTNVPTVRWSSGPFSLPYIGTYRACVGHRWTAKVSKSGPVAVVRSDDAVRIAVPLEIDGKAGVKGDIARVLALNGKNFRASVLPTVDLRLSLGKDWCPAVNASATRNWVSSASVELIGRNCARIDLGPLGSPGFCAGPVNLDLAGAANDALNGQQQAVQTAAANAIRCDAFREAVASQWRAIALPVEGGGEGPLFLNVIPESFAFSRVRVVDDAVEFAVRAGVKAQLNEVPVPTDPLPLPAVEPLEADQSQLNVALAANVGYPRLASVLKPAVVGKSFGGKTAAGDVKIQVEDIDVYPSQGRVVVGVKVRADLPGRIFDTRGWIYLTATPVVDESGTKVRLSDLNYSAAIDNALWQAFATVFDDQIRRTLEANASIDLQPVLAEQGEVLMRQINAASIPGGKIKADVPEVKVKDVRVDATKLAVDVALNVQFELTLTGEGL